MLKVLTNFPTRISPYFWSGFYNQTFHLYMAKADIDFEKELWDAANELRGAVSENNYKNYILPLVFVKHLSERYEVVREELKEQLNDPKSDY